MPDEFSVLIVDDAQEDRFILKRFLQKTGLDPVMLEANHGAEAIELLISPLEELQNSYPNLCPPLIIFLDINMPMMNGWEFLDELEARTDEIQLKPVTVVLHTTSQSARDEEKAKNYASVAKYLTKHDPNADRLKAVILDLL